MSIRSPMQSGDKARPEALITSDLLNFALVFFIVRPVFTSVENTVQYCSQAGYSVTDFEVKDSTNGWSVISLSTGQTLSESALRDLLDRKQVSGDQIHAAVYSISGSLLGASFGSAVVARLFEIRPRFSLPDNEYVRLLSTVWPGLLNAGGWPYWQAVFESMLAQDALTTVDRLQLLRWAAVAARWQGQYKHAEEQLHSAMGLASHHTYETEYGRCLLEMVVLHRQRGRFESARAMLLKATRLLEDSGSELDKERCILESCQLSLETGEPAQAIALLEGVADTAASLALRADALLLLGEHSAALECAIRALGYAPATKHIRGRVFATLGRIHLVVDQLPDAQNALESAMQMMHETGDRVGVWRVQILLGQVYAHAGDFQTACDLVEIAYAEQASLVDLFGQRRSLPILVEICADAAEYWLLHGDEEVASTFAMKIRKYTDLLSKSSPGAS